MLVLDGFRIIRKKRGTRKTPSAKQAEEENNNDSQARTAAIPGHDLRFS
jgi:hypothetical protein